MNDTLGMLPNIGTVGTVVNPENGVDWGRKFKVVGRNPVKGTLSVESLERLTQHWPGGIIGPDGQAQPPRSVYREDLPLEVSEHVPASWFTPDPAA